MQVLCGLQVLFLLFNCQTPEDRGDDRCQDHDNDHRFTERLHTDLQQVTGVLKYRVQKEERRMRYESITFKRKP